MRESRRYLGLELAGAKNTKTTLAALEFYPKEKKIFLLDIFDRIAQEEGQSADEALIELVDDFRPQAVKMGVNVPLTLPPCIICTRKTCPQISKCTVFTVKWMRETVKKVLRSSDRAVRKFAREFTPYTQRPVELWLRYQVLNHLPPSHRFEIDETMGGNRAPLTARMHYLKHHLRGVELCEVLPKLTIALLALEWGLERRVVANYRHLEKGESAREVILEHFIEIEQVFIYDRDFHKLAKSLTCFDAFLCAFTAMISDQHRSVRPPSGFPWTSGWVEYPQWRKAGDGNEEEDLS